jgi:hypothetical protein
MEKTRAGRVARDLGTQERHRPWANSGRQQQSRACHGKTENAELSAREGKLHGNAMEAKQRGADKRQGHDSKEPGDRNATRTEGERGSRGTPAAEKNRDRGAAGARHWERGMDIGARGGREIQRRASSAKVHATQGLEHRRPWESEAAERATNTREGSTARRRTEGWLGDGRRARGARRRQKRQGEPQPPWEQGSSRLGARR